ncbi:PAS domain S-box protein [Lysobacter sp. BMK333-48F3]|nr:PAS domain S-box protein [Lysobacter sp. BMK333-48F3]
MTSLDIPAPATEAAMLLHQPRQLELLIAGVVDYAIYMLDPSGRIASWNPGGVRIKGYQSEEVIGRHFSMFYTPQDNAAGVPEAALAQARDTGRFEAEGWRVRKDGTRFWAHVVIDAIRENGELIGFAKVTRDITERKQAERELEEARSALLQSQKLEAVGQLTYGLAHDFNNLLTVALNSLERMKNVRGDAEKFDRAAGTARRALDRGTRLTKQLLAFSRGQTLRPKAVDVNALLRDAEVLLARVCDERIQLLFELHSPQATIQVDPSQLEAALLNLVINARDAIGEGGSIRIGTRTAGDALIVSVADDGHGMPAEVAKRATEPFFTTKEIGRGSGLGLSQVYGFVRQSGGTFELQSAPGNGTTVLMHFPLTASAAPEDRISVLLVDDDENILDVVQDSLADAGYAVTVAKSGKQALEILDTDAQIDIVFSDVSMPGGVSGIDLASRLLELRPQVRVILTSGYSPNWLPEMPPNCEFMPKPYELSDLDRKLKRLRRRRA